MNLCGIPTHESELKCVRMDEFHAQFLLLYVSEILVQVTAEKQKNAIKHKRASFTSGFKRQNVANGGNKM